MKSYKLFAIVFSIAALFAFSSCERDDYFWTDGSLDYTRNVPIAPNGKIADNLYIDYSWVQLNKGYRNVSIEDIKFRGGYIYIKPQIYLNDRLTLRLANSNAFIDFWPVRYPDYIEDDSPEAQDFLNAVVEVMRRNGSATVYVDGYGAGSSSFILDLIMDIDVYVRD